MKGRISEVQFQTVDEFTEPVLEDVKPLQENWVPGVFPDFHIDEILVLKPWDVT